MESHRENIYEKDFYAWTFRNAELLRKGKFSQVDIKNVAEEIESMGRRDKRELVSRLAVLMAHLLKWQFEPGLRGKSWKYTIKEQRIQVGNLLQESPSLKHEIELKMDEAYREAVVIVVAETPLDEEDLPHHCPFSLSQCLDEQFLPVASSFC